MALMNAGTTCVHARILASHGNEYLPDLEGDHMPDVESDAEPIGRLVDQKVVPVIEETAVVYKERVVTERVRLRKRVHTDQKSLDIPVQAETIEVERTPVGAW